MKEDSIIICILGLIAVIGILRIWRLFHLVPLNVIYDKWLYQAAFNFATSGRTHEAIYTDNKKLRPDIKYMIDMDSEWLRSIFQTEAKYIFSYINHRNKRLIHENGFFRRVHIKRLAVILCDYICYEHDNVILYMKGNAESFGVTPEEFFKIKRTIQNDYVGVYIIYNKSKNMYYVGQAKRLYFRVHQHFTGHGNGDVYADYKYGDSFVIRLMLLSESGYSDLDLLERDMIRQYNAFTTGYNKTVGNRSVKQVTHSQFSQYSSPA